MLYFIGKLRFSALICRIARLSRSNSTCDTALQALTLIFLVKLKNKVPARGKFEIVLHQHKIYIELWQAVSLVLFNLERCAIQQIIAENLSFQMRYSTVRCDKICIAKISNFQISNFSKNTKMAIAQKDAGKCMLTEE